MTDHSKNSFHTRFGNINLFNPARLREIQCTTFKSRESDLFPNPIFDKCHATRWLFDRRGQREVSEPPLVRRDNKTHRSERSAVFRELGAVNQWGGGTANREPHSAAILLPDRSLSPGVLMENVPCGCLEG